MQEFRPKHQTLIDIFDSSTAIYADRPLFGLKQQGHWQWITYDYFKQQVIQLEAALYHFGIRHGDRVAIISNNRPEWAMIAYATYRLGAVFVAMYEAQNEHEWHYILQDSAAKIVFVPGQVIASKITARWKELPQLENLVVLEGPTDKSWKSWNQILKESSHTITQATMVSPHDTATIIYTSGTTGNPKGVVLTHLNIASNIAATHILFPANSNDRSLSFLPWAHIFGQTCELHALISIGASIAIVESTNKIVDNMKEIKPTFLCAVPRVFMKIYLGIKQKFLNAGGIQNRLFLSAIATAEKRNQLLIRHETNGFLELKQSVYDRLIFSKIREQLGGNLRYVISGAAALPKEISLFLDYAGIPVFEGYGLSETSPIVSVNSPGARKIGSVGKVIPGVVVDIDTSVTSDPKNGEVIVYGHNVMKGYYNLETENQKVFIEKNGERGLRTGDMGFIDGMGFLHITGRIKEQYKLLNGKYIVPTLLEDQLSHSPYISNCMIYGDNRDYNIAIIAPNFPQLTQWAQDLGLAAAPRTLVRDERVRTLYKEQINEFSSKFKLYEKIKTFILVGEDFTIENGMITPKLSLKRHSIIEKYKTQIEDIYQKNPHR